VRLVVGLVLVSLSAAPAVAAKVDVVVLQNGSRIVGEVRSMSKARLELGTDDMGTLQIEWGKVKEIAAPEFFEVEDMGGRLLFGSLRRGAAEGTLEVFADWGTEALPLPRVARIQLVKSSFWARFRGSIDAGASYTSASELLQVELDGDLSFRRPRFELTAGANAVISQQPDVDDTRRSSATLGYTRLFGSRHRAFAQATAEQNRELGFELRSSLLTGWGYMLARDARNELVGGAGISVNRERPVEGESTTNAEAVLGFNWANFAYDFPNTDVQVTTYAYFGLNQWGRVRVEANASLRREVFKNFYVGVKAYESYDSEPASEGAQKNDWGASLTLGYSF
jgi:outer membrane scaffolding protein for murein synthesis (MipA/OmpV family)